MRARGARLQACSVDTRVDVISPDHADSRGKHREPVQSVRGIQPLPGARQIGVIAALVTHSTPQNRNA
jgi:hypothetical protein